MSSYRYIDQGSVLEVFSLSKKNLDKSNGHLIDDGQQSHLLFFQKNRCQDNSEVLESSCCQKVAQVQKEEKEKGRCSGIEFICIAPHAHPFDFVGTVFILLKSRTGKMILNKQIIIVFFRIEQTIYYLLQNTIDIILLFYLQLHKLMNERELYLWPNSLDTQSFVKKLFNLEKHNEF